MVRREDRPAVAGPVIRCGAAARSRDAAAEKCFERGPLVRGARGRCPASPWSGGCGGGKAGGMRGMRARMGGLNLFRGRPGREGHPSLLARSATPPQVQRKPLQGTASVWVG